MCIIREHTNSFEVLCYWIREFSNSIKELRDTSNTPAVWKNDGIKELFNSITELSKRIRELFNLFKDELN